MDRGSNDGVIERCAPLRGDFLQRLLEQSDVRGKVLIQVGILTEVDHKSFIVRIAGPNQIEHRLIYLVPLFAHRTGIVDYDAKRYRNVVSVKGRGRLRHAVLERRESRSVEIGNQSALLIYHNGVQDNFLHFLFEHEEGGIVCRWLPVRLLRRGRASALRRRGIACWGRLRDARRGGCTRNRGGSLTLDIVGYQSQEEAYADQHQAAPPLETS